MAVKRPVKQYLTYATGKKVYSNGSYAPTRGRVDPRGYVKREMANKRVSQRRSGLAAAAIRRLSPNKPQSGLGLKSYNAYIKKHSAPKPAPKPAVPKPKPVTGPVGVGGPTNGNLGGSVPKVVPINPNGQLDLPYDEDLAWQVLQSKQDTNSALLDLQMQQQQQSQEFSRMQRDAGLDFENVQRGTLNSDAARGMAFSSGHGQNIANNSRNYNNYMNDITNQNTLFNQGIDLNRMQIQNSLSEMLRQAGLAQAQRLQDRAGELGYGQSPIDPAQGPLKLPTIKKPAAPKPAAKKTAAKKTAAKKRTKAGWRAPSSVRKGK